MPEAALKIYAGPRALRHIKEVGLAPSDVRVIAGAAGGPKGLILGPLDRFIFGHWLARSAQTVHLLGASIGAWRMATAAAPDPAKRLQDFETAYIEQHYEPEPGRKLPSAALISRVFGENIRQFFQGEVEQILAHERYRLHVVTTRGRHFLAREGRWRSGVGYAALALSNAISRSSISTWVERVVFSSPGQELPIDLSDLRSSVYALRNDNFHAALQASCSIPFLLEAVEQIAGAPDGAYWDGGITDYHLHWRYDSMNASGLVLYPHFQKHLVPGWLDKPWKRRHRSTPWLDNVIVLAPSEAWVQGLPGSKLPDRNDFTNYGLDLAGRIRHWRSAVAQSEQLADEFAHWLQQGCPTDRVECL